MYYHRPSQIELDNLRASLHDPGRKCEIKNKWSRKTTLWKQEDIARRGCAPTDADAAIPLAQHRLQLTLDSHATQLDELRHKARATAAVAFAAVAAAALAL